MPRIHLGLALTLAALALLVTVGRPPASHAGEICDPLMVSSPSSPVPSDFAQVLVGEEVLFEATFPPNTEVTVTFSHNAVIVDESIMNAEADGSLAFVVVFEPEDILEWQISVEAPDICGSSVDLVVEPAEANVAVGVGTYLCPDDIQSMGELEAAGGESACDVAKLPHDSDPTPEGYTTNLVAAEFDFDLFSADGLARSIENATLDGGGICDPATLTCTYAFSYRWDFVASGEAALELDGPSGYRLGHVTVMTVGEPPQSVGSPVVDLETASVVFDVPEDEPIIVRAFWFADASAPTPTPTPAPLPDTAMDRPSAPTAPLLIGAGLVFLAASLTCCGDRLTRGVRRPR